jgi:1,4-dihydroxy-2-naphthoate octaprenyltransferase
MFLTLLEVAVVSLISVFFFFQIFMPIWNGTVLLPTFRKKARELEKEMRKVKFDVELEETRKQLKELQKERND